MTPAKIDGPVPHPDEDTMEVSAFVQLLVARMKSHPQEFYTWDHTSMRGLNANPLRGNGVSQLVESTKALWNRKEKRLYNMALREARMQEAYERLVTKILK